LSKEILKTKQKTNMPIPDRTKQNWIEKGYEHFALTGPNKFSVNKVSKMSGLSRASFYHHFGDIDIFFEELLMMHWQITEMFIHSGREHCRQLIPDLYDLLEQNPIPLKFALQLFHHRSAPEFNFIFIKSYEAIAKGFALKLFSNHLDFTQTGEEVYHLWLTLGEAWYSRLDPNDLSSGTLQKHAQEIMKTLSMFVNSPLYTHLRKTV
jgi:AcrR family transcriptional regulator